MLADVRQCSYFELGLPVLLPRVREIKFWPCPSIAGPTIYKNSPSNVPQHFWWREGKGRFWICSFVHSSKQISLLYGGNALMDQGAFMVSISCCVQLLPFILVLHGGSHRRTGNFLPGGGGGGGKPFAQKVLASVPNFYKRVEKKRGPYCNNIGRTGVWRWLDTVFQGKCQVWA